MIHGYSPNKMVNRNNSVQNERGVKFVRIDATNYKGSDAMFLLVASEEYRMTPFWIGLNTVEVIAILLSFFEGYCTYM